MVDLKLLLETDSSSPFQVMSEAMRHTCYGQHLLGKTRVGGVIKAAETRKDTVSIAAESRRAHKRVRVKTLISV